MLTHSTNWAIIAESHVPQRTRLALKNRYFALRLKHENVNKEEGPTRKTTKKRDVEGDQTQAQVSTGQEERNMLSGLDDDDDDDDEDEDEDDGDNEDRVCATIEIKDNRNIRRTRYSKTRFGEMGGNLMGINDGTSHMQSQAVMDVGANGWSGSAGDPVLSSPEPFPHDAGSFSVDDWGKDATSHLHYENLSTLTPEKGYLSAIENLSVFTAACSRETYGR